MTVVLYIDETGSRTGASRLLQLLVGRVASLAQFSKSSRRFADVHDPRNYASLKGRYPLVGPRIACLDEKLLVLSRRKARTDLSQQRDQPPSPLCP